MSATLRRERNCEGSCISNGRCQTKSAHPRPRSATSAVRIPAVRCAPIVLKNSKIERSPKSFFRGRRVNSVDNPHSRACRSVASLMTEATGTRFGRLIQRQDDLGSGPLTLSCPRLEKRRGRSLILGNNQCTSWLVWASIPNTSRVFGPDDTALGPVHGELLARLPSKPSGPLQALSAYHQCASSPEPASTPKTSTRPAPHETALGGDADDKLPPNSVGPLHTPSHDQCASWLVASTAKMSRRPATPKWGKPIAPEESHADIIRASGAIPSASTGRRHETHWHEPLARTTYRLVDRRRVNLVAFVAAHVGLYMRGRQQPNFMPELRQRPPQ